MRDVWIGVAIVSVVLVVGGSFAYYILWTDWMEPVQGTVTGITSQWHSDGFTYSNLTVSYHGMSGFLIDRCDYFKIGSLMTIQYMPNQNRLYTVNSGSSYLSDVPMPAGCSPY